MVRLDPSSSSSQRNFVTYESSKATSIGWFSGGKKDRLSLEGIDNKVIKIAAIHIADPDRQENVTTTFGFKTHHRFTIDGKTYDVNISSLSKRMGMTRDKVTYLIIHNPDLTQFFSTFRENYKNLESKLQEAFPSPPQDSKVNSVSNLMEFLSVNKNRLENMSMEEIDTFGEFTITREGQSLVVSKSNSGAKIHLDPSDALKLEPKIEKSEKLKALVGQNPSAKTYLDPSDEHTLEPKIEKLEKLKALVGQNPLEKCFDGLFNFLTGLGEQEKNEWIKIVKDELGIKRFVEFAEFCAGKEIPNENLVTLFRQDNTFINLEKLKTLIGQNPSENCFDDLFNFFKDFNSNQKNEWIKIVKDRLGIKLFVGFAKFCAGKETPGQKLETLFRDESTLIIKAFKIITEEYTEKDLKEAIDKLLEHHILSKDGDHLNTSTWQYDEEFKKAAIEVIPKFIQSIGLVMQRMPAEFKEFLRNMRDCIRQLHSKQDTEAELNSNNAMIATLFLREITPRIFAIKNNPGIMGVLQNCGNQSGSNKQGRYSYFDETINKMKKEGVFTRFAEQLLSDEIIP
jgi:hypothetical protein